ncbi:MAG: hypothetical protein IPL22_04950 [Bacteroidetes bacterium]|nr:hypothetical protein [Bacteroidota bacterium]
MLSDVLTPDHQAPDLNPSEYQEADIIRLLLTYGEEDLYFIEPINERESHEVTEKVKSFYWHELNMDEISFEHPVYAKIYKEFENMVHQEAAYQSQYIVNHDDQEIRQLAADILTPKYQLADWNSRNVFIKEEISRVKHAALSAVYSIK